MLPRKSLSGLICVYSRVFAANPFWITTMRVLCICITLLWLWGWTMPTGAGRVSARTPAQVRLTVHIAHLFDGKPLRMETVSLHNRAGNTLSVTRLAYLISDVALRDATGETVTLANQVAYINPGEGRDTFTLPPVPAGRYVGLSFHIGLPPTRNHADPSRYPANHPLHPLVNRLHWGWQGGYVFLALEGRYQQADGKLSGYSYHLATDKNLMTVRLNQSFNVEQDSAMNLAFDVAKVFSAAHEIAIQPNGNDSTHSTPGDKLAEQLTANIQKSFRFNGLQRAEPFAKQPVKANEIVTAPASRLTPYPFPAPAHFPQPNLPADNPLTVQGVALGKRLFFETRLSGNNTQSCASCHQPEYAFANGGKAVSIGIDGKPGTRRAMPLFNLAWQSAFTWDGRRTHLRDQILAPIQDAREMRQSLPQAVAKLQADSNYPQLFTEAFGSFNPNSEGTKLKIALNPQPLLPQKRISKRSRNTQHGGRGVAHFQVLKRTKFMRVNLKASIDANRSALAIEQYLLTLVSADAKFDRALRGEAQFTDEEKRGLLLFITEYDPARGKTGADCFHCHGGNLFTDYQFRNNGLDAQSLYEAKYAANSGSKEGLKDAGQFLVTGREADRGKFKTPSLRNVELTAPYMHDGRFRTLEEVVRHYNAGVQRSNTLDPNIAKHPDSGMALSDADVRALVAFLKTLTDARFH